MYMFYDIYNISENSDIPRDRRIVANINFTLYCAFYLKKDEVEDHYLHKENFDILCSYYTGNTYHQTRQKGLFYYEIIIKYTILKK